MNTMFILYKINKKSCMYSCKRLATSTTNILVKENLPATAYRPEIVEKNKYDKWENAGLFEAENCSNKNNFSIILPPPNVTGKLHLGHALACTIQDVIVRRKRSLGYNVLWLPGTDHAGIATQSIVEKYLKSKENINRYDIGREKFIQEVWKWREKYGDSITEQLRTLGCSLDWSRQVFTMDPKHTKAVNTAFIQLFHNNLIYRKKALVNWCNALKSTVSDIEVENVPINEPSDLSLPNYIKPVRFGLIYDFAYKVYDSTEEIIVSTTMPETMLGDVAVAVHPEDKRYQHLEGKRVIHPFRTNETIPIIFDKFVDREFGTGAVKITPAHSKIDYEVAKQHNLPLLQVINVEGLIENTEIFQGLKRYDCRSILVHKLDDLGLMKEIKPHIMTLPICSRSGNVIDHLPKEQWFLSCAELNKKARECVENRKLKIIPENFIQNWFNWTDDGRDWCISRQLWWGHQIPAYMCSVDEQLTWVAATDESSAKQQASKHFKTLPDLIKVERDTDVLDTWFSSGIYPFAALGWPDHDFSRDYTEFYPLSLLATGHDILGFWVHRMVILGLELTGKVPFEKVLLHGIVCDNKGAKMSKSRGNVIDPIDVIEGISLDDLKKKSEEMHKSGILNKDELKKAYSYHKANFSATNGIPECGVDALRFTLLSQDIKSHFVNFDVSYCHSNKLFCNKIWQSIKYTQLSYAKLKVIDSEITKQDLTFFDRWILSRLAYMVQKVNDTMESYDFQVATKAIRTLIYNEFCDIYLEASKPGFENDNIKIGFAHAHTLSAVLNTSLRCLYPFMVYITQELIPTIPDFERNVIINFKDASEKFLSFPKTEDYVEWKNEIIEEQAEKILNAVNLIRELKGLYSITNKVRPIINVRTDNENLIEAMKDNVDIITHLTRAKGLTFNGKDDKTYVKGILDLNTEIYVELVGDDIENAITNAKNKLEKRIKKLEDSLNNMEEKYSNSNYLTTIPEWTQVRDHEKLMAKRKELKELQRLI